MSENGNKERLFWLGSDGFEKMTTNPLVKLTRE